MFSASPGKGGITDSQDAIRKHTRLERISKQILEKYLCQKLTQILSGSISVFLLNEKARKCRRKSKGKRRGFQRGAQSWWLLGFSCLSPSTTAGRARGTSEQGLVLAVTKWLTSSIQELKNLPKQKSRPRRSNYTWGGGGRGDEEKKTSITEPLPHETQRGLGGTRRRRGLSRAGCKHTPDPCPRLGNTDLSWAPGPTWKPPVQFQRWDQLELLSGSPQPGRAVVQRFLSQLEEFRLGHGSMDVSCCCHRCGDRQRAWKANG